SSPLNIAKIASKAVTTLSLNSIADSQAPTNLSFNPSMKFRNVSDLLYANTNPAPSAAIAAIVKVIGDVSAPNNGANHLSSPPAFAIDAKTGAITVTTLAATLTKVPSANNTGPIATTIKPSHFCQPAIGKLSHISPSTRLMLSANVTTELFKLLNNISMFAPS